MDTTDYIAHIERSILNAIQHRSKLLPFHLSMDGMSSHKNRHLFNNVGAFRVPDRRTRYLEVGSWKGSTLCSLLFNNSVDAVAIDNFSQFHDISFIGKPQHPKTALDLHVKETQELASVPFDLRFIDADAFTIDPATLGLFDIFFYDGEHSFEAQKRAFTYFAPCLRDVFIALVDDYHDPNTQQATREGIAEGGFTVVRDWHLERLGGDLPQLMNGWWNGVYVAVCQRKG